MVWCGIIWYGIVWYEHLPRCLSFSGQSISIVGYDSETSFLLPANWMPSSFVRFFAFHSATVSFLSAPIHSELLARRAATRRLYTTRDLRQVMAP